MALQYPIPNHRSVPEYQMSGMPYVTSSASSTEVPISTGTPIEVIFPSVTRWVCVTNTGAKSLRIGFSANGVKNHGVDGSYNITGSGGRYFILPFHTAVGVAQPTRLEVQCNKLFFLSDDGSTGTGFSLMAGLTGIPVNQYPNVTGSDEWQGVG